MIRKLNLIRKIKTLNTKILCKLISLPLLQHKLDALEKSLPKNGYEKQVEISSDVIIQNINYDFRVTPENRKYVTIGEGSLIGRATFTFETRTGEVTIGKNVYVGGVHFICRTKIEIEDDVMFSWGITLYDHDAHSIYWEDRKKDLPEVIHNYKNNKDLLFNHDWSAVKSKPVKICSKAWIGFDTVILKGVTIGEGAVVGARSVVTKDVPAWSVVAGNPARVVKQLEKPKE